MSRPSSPAPSWLGRYVEVIDSRVSGIFGGGSSSLEVAVKGALYGGKRIRAVLALLWCEAVSGGYEAAVPVAVAYELAHAAALVQDDILDESGFRRGERSIVGKHGLRSAILASNMLLAQVPREIAGYGSLSSGGEILRMLFDLLGESFGAAVLGEFLDLEMASRDSVSQSDYEYMIKMKTGALVGASSASGVVVGGGMSQKVTVKTAYEFGEWLGMAYQVHDDLLDIIGDEETLGKAVFTDIRGGKKNIVLIHALERSSEEDRLFLRELLGREQFRDAEVRRVRGLLSQTRSVEYAQGVAASYAENARRLLEAADVGATRGKLLELSDYLSSRKY
ncbi:MAG: polyprenyl synthetase family protein [Thaumarchaeota archaeon]|nr:polyprenyl synthetase family protein [Nitrososphaerota archaeon]